jgi:HPt (histidine-containing phosphotransfer) domain-containing protein
VRSRRTEVQIDHGRNPRCGGILTYVSSGRSGGATTRLHAAVLLEAKFIGHRERDVSTILECLEGDDYEGIARTGHNLRGNGPSYGFPELAIVGEALERAAQARDASRVREAASQLEAWTIAARERRGEQGAEPRFESGTQRIDDDHRRDS